MSSVFKLITNKNRGVVYPNEATGNTLSPSQTAALKALAKQGDGIELYFFSDQPTSGYAESRKMPMYGGDHEDFPSCIIHPKNTQEVSAALECCHNSNIRDISIYNGGHSTQGMKGSVVIKLSALNIVSVRKNKPGPHIVTFGGGCTNAQVDAACKPYGVAITSGNAPALGAVGSLLGGGVGYLARWQGLAIDNLVEATVVLSDGEIVVATKDENSDLLFALKGGGGNFGVVTEVKVRARMLDFDPSYRRGEVYYETRVVRHGNSLLGGNGMGESTEVFSAWRDYALEAPDHVSCDCVLPTGGPMVQAFTYKGSHESALAESANEWSALGDAAKKTIAKPANYFEVVQNASTKHMDYNSPSPHVYRTVIMDSLPDEAVQILMEACTTGAPNKHSLIHVERLGGKIDDPDDGAENSAYAHRGAQFWISIIGVYSVRGRKQSSHHEVDIWIDKLYNNLRPFAIGRDCTGAMGYWDHQTQTMVKENAFGDMGYKGDKKIRLRIAKIVAAKKKYDPDNVFKYVENGFSNVSNVDPGHQISLRSLTVSPMNSPVPVTPSSGSGRKRKSVIKAIEKMSLPLPWEKGKQ